MALSIQAVLLYWMSFMLSVVYAECRKQTHNADCHYGECRYSEGHGVISSTCCFVECKKVSFNDEKTSFRERKMPSRQNAKLTKCQFDKMPN